MRSTDIPVSRIFGRRDYGPQHTREYVCVRVRDTKNFASSCFQKNWIRTQSMLRLLLPLGLSSTWITLNKTCHILCAE